MEITLLYILITWQKSVMFLLSISLSCLICGMVNYNFFRPAEIRTRHEWNQNTLLHPRQYLIDFMEKLSFKKFGCSNKNTIITAVIIVGIKVCFKQTFELCNAAQIQTLCNWVKRRLLARWISQILRHKHWANRRLTRRIGIVLMSRFRN